MTEPAVKRLISFATVILVAVLFAFNISARVRKLNGVYQFATTGTSISDVTTRLGSPWRETVCGVIFGGTEPQGCDRELIYAHPFPSVVPRYWAFRYDRNAKLIDKYEYVLP